ncbi:MAG: hypothetical protein AVDCRST_MAG80-910, partial [uncultured Rubrobacteraceae bacterium]
DRTLLAPGDGGRVAVELPTIVPKHPARLVGGPGGALRAPLRASKPQRTAL